MANIGIFSGAFDPIHKGHLQFARDAQARLDIDKIFFLPESRPRRKQGVKAFEHRLEMVKLAIRNDDKFGLIVLEQERFTPHETLSILQARFHGAKLHILIGDDMLRNLGSWPHVEELIKATKFIIGSRGEPARALNLINAIEYTRGINFDYQIFQSFWPAISSQKIKTELRKKHRSDKLPPAVQDYIIENKLYISRDVS